MEDSLGKRVDRTTNSEVSFLLTSEVRFLRVSLAVSQPLQGLTWVGRGGRESVASKREGRAWVLLRENLPEGSWEKSTVGCRWHLCSAALQNTEREALHARWPQVLPWLDFVAPHIPRFCQCCSVPGTAPKWNGLFGLLCRSNKVQVWLLISSYSQGTTAGELKHQGLVGMYQTHTIPSARSWHGLLGESGVRMAAAADGFGLHEPRWVFWQKARVTAGRAWWAAKQGNLLATCRKICQKWYLAAKHVAED